MKIDTSINDFRECKLNSFSQQSKMNEFNNICLKYEFSTVVAASTTTDAPSD